MGIPHRNTLSFSYYYKGCFIGLLSSVLLNNLPKILKKKKKKILQKYINKHLEPKGKREKMADPWVLTVSNIF